MFTGADLGSWICLVNHTQVDVMIAFMLNWEDAVESFTVTFMIKVEKK